MVLVENASMFARDLVVQLTGHALTLLCHVSLSYQPKERRMRDKVKKDSQVEGEGSYSGTKAYNKATEEFLKKGKVDEAAREAKRALNSE